ncbi:MAG: NADH-quinone oxidoreductase subunit C [Chloroflexi bacterium]|nr:NADH-quinone oxidoreductase subunit C [Chloroflexota bacterium]MYF64700.1 NADH-quinone oxidoreductase subunit C [Chloroflexota bacterium]MYK35698.1 NADH-quinone oxidoreductase subunit C [Chloroflexota bacterium]
MTTATAGNALAESLRSPFPDAVVESDESAVWIEPSAIADVCAFLRDDPAHDYQMLGSLTAVDYVEYFEVVYHLTSLSRNATAILKARVYGRDDVSLPSVTGVWRGATLQEREAWDLMGVGFDGHPNLKRILTWEGFQGHPLRRDYLEPPLPYSWPQGG